MDRSIKNQRWKAGRLSQIELAQLSKVSRYRISLAEIGHIKLRDDEWRAIDLALVGVVRRRAKAFSVRSDEE